MQGVGKGDLGPVRVGGDRLAAEEQIRRGEPAVVLILTEGEVELPGLVDLIGALLYGIVGREGQFSVAEVAALEQRQPMAAGVGEFAVGDIRTVVDVEADLVTVGEASGAGVIEAGPGFGVCEIHFEPTVVGSHGGIGHLAGAGCQQAGLKAQGHPYSFLHHSITRFVLCGTVSPRRVVLTPENGPAGVVKVCRREWVRIKSGCKDRRFCGICKSPFAGSRGAVAGRPTGRHGGD